MIYREIQSNIAQIPNINCYDGETCAVYFSKYMRAKFTFTFIMFTDCTNLSDVCQNFINRNVPTINLLPEHQYISKSKLRIRIFLWKFPEKKLPANRFNEVIIQLKTLQIIYTWITWEYFKRYSSGSLIFAFIRALSN